MNQVVTYIIPSKIKSMFAGDVARYIQSVDYTRTPYEVLQKTSDILKSGMKISFDLDIKTVFSDPSIFGPITEVSIMDAEPIANSIEQDAPSVIREIMEERISEFLLPVSPWTGKMCKEDFLKNLKKLGFKEF